MKSHDINGDGKVDEMDDVNGDGVVDDKDAAALQAGDAGGFSVQATQKAGPKEASPYDDPASGAPNENGSGDKGGKCVAKKSDGDKKKPADASTTVTTTAT